MTILSQNQIAALALQAGVPANQLQTASAIAMAESGGDTNSVNPGHPGDPEYSVGLWQININAHKQYNATQMKDPQQNAAAMFKISGGSNWSAWGAYTNGSYKQFMTTPISSIATLSNIVPRNPNAPGYQQPSNTTSNPAVTTDIGSGFKWILAYIIAITIMVFIARFKAGYAAIYYVLVLAILFLLVTQSRFIWNSLSPLFTSTSGESTSPVAKATKTKGVVTL